MLIYIYIYIYNDTKYCLKLYSDIFIFYKSTKLHGKSSHLWRREGNMIMGKSFKSFCNIFTASSGWWIHKIITVNSLYKGFPDGSLVKNSPAMQEMWVQPLGQEDPLEKGVATHSSILAWGIPWTEKPGGPTYKPSSYELAKMQTCPVCQLLYCTTVLSKVLYCKIKNCVVFNILSV